jgi:hypothetical protein
MATQDVTDVSSSDDSAPMRVGELAELYLGNILFALERTAITLDGEHKPEDAAFYRGIGRALADAHGRDKAGPRP